MADLATAVMDDHRRLLRMAHDLARRYERWPLWERAANKAMQRFVSAEARHETAEAQYLWPVVREVVEGGAELRRRGRLQEKRGRQELHRLYRSAGRPESPAYIVAVIDLLASHIQFEEHHVLPGVAAGLDLRQAFRIGDLFEQACRTGPTRPHPKLPAQPGVLKAALPLLAKADRVLDVISRR